MKWKKNRTSISLGVVILDSKRDLRYAVVHHAFKTQSKMRNPLSIQAMVCITILTSTKTENLLVAAQKMDLSAQDKYTNHVNRMDRGLF